MFGISSAFDVRVLGNVSVSGGRVLDNSSVLSGRVPGNFCSGDRVLGIGSSAVSSSDDSVTIASSSPT
ncbi:unnamed protein product [Cochlearia groenlandica]